MLTRKIRLSQRRKRKKAIAHRNGVTKAEKGHFDKAGVSGKRYVKEFRFDNAEEYALAQEIKADIFAEGDHRSMRQQSPKVKVSRARSNVTDRAEDL